MINVSETSRAFRQAFPFHVGLRPHRPFAGWQVNSTFVAAVSAAALLMLLARGIVYVQELSGILESLLLGVLMVGLVDSAANRLFPKSSCGFRRMFVITWFVTLACFVVIRETYLINWYEQRWIYERFAPDNFRYLLISILYASIAFVICLPFIAWLRAKSSADATAAKVIVMFGLNILMFFTTVFFIKG